MKPFKTWKIFSEGLKNRIQQYGWIYLATLAALFFLKLFYRNADSTDLKWLLAPTAWWVRVLSGISFENIPHIGYVNHDLRFIIARSCSGFQFMLITAAALIFSFLHRIVPEKKISSGLIFMLGGFGISYLLTILVNGLRIIVSIELPMLLGEWGVWEPGGVRDSLLHTLIGTVVYFSSLLIIYQLADKVTLRISRTAHCRTDAGFVPGLLRPACWYFFFVLGIPLLNRASRSESGQFRDYAALVSFVCAVILMLAAFPNIIKRCHAS